MSARKPIALVIGTLSVLAFAQAWKPPYEKALKAAGENRWAVARDAFKESTVDRPEDEETGGVAGPYSPNFGAAYAAYRMAQEANSESARSLYLLASQELEVLVGKKRASREAFLLLARCYEKLDRPVDAQAAETKARQADVKWRADTSFLAADVVLTPAAKPPVEKTAEKPVEKPKPLDAPQAKGTQPKPVETVTPKPAEAKPVETKPVGTKPSEQKPTRPPRLDDAPKRPNSTPNPSSQATPAKGPVPIVPTKFALVIGNSQSSITDLNTPFASASAGVVKAALTNDAGYDPANVVLLTDAKSDDIRRATLDLAQRVPENGVVFIYFAGVGVNVDGKDYLAGTDTSSAVDTTSMVAKSEVLGQFVVRGARIFAFYECNRPQVNKGVFGQEPVVLGSIAQTYGTASGQFAYSAVSGGQNVGLFARSVASVLKQFRTNAVPVSEFVWEVFYNMKRGGESGEGGGTLQTPTLPEVRNMPSEARF